ncbi:MAG: hypothetical protein U0587_00195 [Candidatus Binatia bacterium]
MQFVYFCLHIEEVLGAKRRVNGDPCRPSYRIGVRNLFNGLDHRDQARES